MSEIALTGHWLPNTWKTGVWDTGIISLLNHDVFSRRWYRQCWARRRGNERGRSDVQKDKNAEAIYANMLDISHSVPVIGLAAYVEEKRRHSGFKIEFGVGCLFIQHNLL